MLWIVVGESWIWSQGDFLFWSPLRELALYSRVLVISWNMSITYKYMYLRTAMDSINTNFWQFSSPNIWTLNIIYPLEKSGHMFAAPCMMQMRIASENQRRFSFEDKFATISAGDKDISSKQSRCWSCGNDRNQSRSSVRCCCCMLSCHTRHKNTRTSMVGCMDGK